MRYLIALPVKKEQAEPIIELRDRFKNLAPRWKITLGPHITLFRPSEHMLDKKEAIEIFKKAPQAGKFSMQFGSYEAFLNYSNKVVYLEPASHAPFKEIKTLYAPTAAKLLEDSSEIWPYHPHLTLINRLDQLAVEKLLSALGQMPKPLVIDFERVCLYKKIGSEPEWVEIASNQLV